MKGAAWPSGARTCPRTAWAAEGWGARFLDSAERPGLEQAVGGSQDAMWPEGAAPDCGPGRPWDRASQAKWGGYGGDGSAAAPTPHPESP